MNSLTKQLHIWTSMLVAGGLLKLPEYSSHIKSFLKRVNLMKMTEETCNRCLLYLRVRFMH